MRQACHTPHLDPWSALFFNIGPGDGHPANVIVFWYLIHDIQHKLFDDGTQRPGACFFRHGFLCNGFQRIIVKLQIHLIQPEQLLVLFDDGVFRFLQYPDHRLFVQTFKGKDNRQAANELWDHAIIAQIIDGHLFQYIRRLVPGIPQCCSKPHGTLPVQPFFDHIFQIRESAAADKQDVPSIHCGQRYHGIFAVGSHWHFHFAAFQQFQKALLDRLPAHITAGRVLFLGDLIDLIDKDNALFRFLHIISSPIYPASVNEVASAMANGTSKSLARVRTR